MTVGHENRSDKTRFGIRTLHLFGVCLIICFADSTMANQQINAPFGSILENMFFQAPSGMKDYCVDLCLCQAMMTMIVIIIVEYCMFSNYLSIY